MYKLRCFIKIKSSTGELVYFFLIVYGDNLKFKFWRILSEGFTTSHNLNSGFSVERKWISLFNVNAVVDLLEQRGYDAVDSECFFEVTPTLGGGM